MYAYTETYFTQNELYHRCKSDEVVVRKCDIKSNAKMDTASQAIIAHKGIKEYDS